jgi:hypothetical protein
MVRATALHVYLDGYHREDMISPILRPKAEVAGELSTAL